MGKYRLLLLLLAGFTHLSCTEYNNQKVTVLKVGHVLHAKHPVNEALLFMAKRLQEESRGRIKMKVYPNAQLGSSVELLEQTKLGIITMTASSAAFLEGFLPDMGVFGLPYIFRDTDHFFKVLDGKVGRELLASARKRNLVGLAYFDSGSRSFYMKDKPIKAPSDLKGNKIRVMQSKMAINMIKGLGGSPTPISYGELYTALQQGVVDGAENNPPSFYSSRHYEICKFYSLDQHTRVPDLLLASKKHWDGFPTQTRELITRVAREASLFQRQLWQKQSDEALAKVQKEGVTIIRPDIHNFAQEVQPLYDEYKGTTIGSLLSRIRNVM